MCLAVFGHGCNLRQAKSAGFKLRPFRRLLASATPVGIGVLLVLDVSTVATALRIIDRKPQCGDACRRSSHPSKQISCTTMVIVPHMTAHDLPG